MRNDAELRDAIPQLAQDGVDGFMVFATPLTFLSARVVSPSLRSGIAYRQFLGRRTTWWRGA